MNRRIVARSLLALAVAQGVGKSFADTDVSNLEDAKVFQAQCLGMARALFPALQLRAPTGRADVVLSGDIEIGLKNLQARFLQSDRTENTLRALIQEHFSMVQSQADHALPKRFTAVSSALRPQFMPVEYRDMGVDVTFPFESGVLIGLVFNHEKNYEYIRQKDLASWDKKPDAALKRAVENLDRISGQIPMQVSSSPGARFVGVETKDGFDAARILIPSLRHFIGTQLTLPFLFGIPNRDFLICWSKDNSSGFQTFARNKVATDFRGQPYPLTERLFEVTTANEIRPADG